MTKNSSKSTFSAPFDLSWHKSFLLFILLWNTYIQLFVLTFALSSWPIWPILGHFRGSRCVKMTQNGSKSFFWTLLPCYESEPLYICLCIWNIVDRVICQHFICHSAPFDQILASFRGMFHAPFDISFIFVSSHFRETPALLACFFFIYSILYELEWTCMLASCYITTFSDQMF